MCTQPASSKSWLHRLVTGLTCPCYSLCLLAVATHLCGRVLQAAMERCKRQTAAAEATARDAEERQWIGVRNAKESARAAAKAVQEARAAQVHCSLGAALCVLGWSV